MSDTSNLYSTQNSQEPRQFRGGEKKVMKKSLKAILAASMAFSMFAGSAFAADNAKTSEDKFQEMKTAGIFQGYPDKKSHLEATMTRAEFAKALAAAIGAADNAAAAASLKDVPANHWARGEIGALYAQKIMEGTGYNMFGPKKEVTLEQLAKIAVVALGLDPQENAQVEGKYSTNWPAAGYIATALDLGLIKKSADYTKLATRGDLVDASYEIYSKGQAASVKEVKIIDDKNIEVVFSDGEVVKKELEAPLKSGEAVTVKVEYKGKTYDVKVELGKMAISGAKQTGAKKITVSFNQPVLETERKEMKFDVKRGPTNVTITPKWADDHKSVVLEASYLTGGEHTVKVNENDPITVTVEAEKAHNIEIGLPALQKANNVEHGIKLLNQFGEKMSQAPQISTFNTTDQNRTVVVNGSKLDASKANLGDKVNIVAVYPAAGLSASKTVDVINGSVATSIKVGEFQPLKDATRITEGDQGLVFPLELVDQNGQKVKLPQTSNMNPKNEQNFLYAGLYFFVSDPSKVSNFVVDSDGVIKFTAAKAGQVQFYITNPATSASANGMLTISGKSAVKELTLGHPNKEIVVNEKVVFPFTAVDSFGQEIKGKDISNFKDRVYISGANIDYDLNPKGELEITFKDAGSYTLYLYVKDSNGMQTPGAPISVLVQNPTYYEAINGIKNVPAAFEVGAKADFKKANVKIIDNLGRETEIPEGYTVESSDNSVLTYDATAQKLVAGKAGTATLTVKSEANRNNAVEANRNKEIATYSFSATVYNSVDIKSYDIETVGTVFSGKDLKDELKPNYVKTVKLVGKVSGTTVALVDNVAPFVYSTDETILQANGSTVTGRKAGEVTISVLKDSVTVASQKVTVSDEAPVAKSAKLTADEYTVAKDGTVTVAVKEVKDQYGVVITPTAYFSVADPSIATVDSKTGVVTGKTANKSTTVTYTTSNGTTATAIILVK
ncbi:S-layer homology domain-containing protein [Paenibacillus sp. GCM10027626]|uniref:S-layer homology domain-containing protein n=1 Tax=Paenibacillus sp. GCM10027626 TaxID=3273411 RepID=UPI003640922B